MLYPFVCPKHGVFEIQRSMKEGPPSTAPCPECDEEAARMYEASAVIYKGSGFHKTDYFDTSRGRGQPMDRKEWLNKNWSEATGEEPPPPSGIKE